MRRHGFDVDVVEDATKADMARAVERLKSKIKPGSVVMLFFGGYGVQSGHETYMIPTDAEIWKEGDVRHEGMSVETVLHAIKERGARATLAVLYVDAIPMNAVSAPTPTGLRQSTRPTTRSSSRLIRLARSPMTRRASTACSLLSCSTSSVRTLALKGVFNKTRVAVFRASNGAQMPSVSSSLLEDVHFSPSNDPDLTTSSLAPITTENAPLVAQK